MATNTNNKKFIYISIFCYLSLILGFILNEDSAGGALYDYNFHLGVRDFLKDTLMHLKILQISNHIILQYFIFF